jgi:hypothetical protein
MISKVDSTIIRTEIRNNDRASELIVHVEINPETLRVRETHLGATILLDDWTRTGKIGGPGLPAKTLWVALPFRKAISGSPVATAIKISPIKSLSQMIAPIGESPRDIPDRTRSRTISVVKQPDHYQAELQKPRPLARLLSTERIGQTMIALIEVNPVFLDQNDRLALATELTVSLTLDNLQELTPAKRQKSDITPVSEAQLDRMFELARITVVNPSDIQPRDCITYDLQARWDYLIVTGDTKWNAAAKTPIATVSPSIVNSFIALSAWKNSLGLKTRIVTVSEIVQSRPGVGIGVDFVSPSIDLQEAIRRFLRWAHDNWGTAYVLIGGDEKIVPIRRLAIGSSWDKQLPTDLYYSALDSLNNDWTEGKTLDYSAFGFNRLMSYISLGRAPVSNSAEADTFVTKVKNYERLRTTGNNLTQDWLKRILYVSTKWGGDDPTIINRSLTFPPGDNLFAQDPSKKYSIIKLIDTVVITQDPNTATNSPSFNCFNRAPGKSYIKIHLAPTYKLAKNIYAITK